MEARPDPQPEPGPPEEASAELPERRAEEPQADPSEAGPDDAVDAPRAEPELPDPPFEAAQTEDERQWIDPEDEAALDELEELVRGRDLEISEGGEDQDDVAAAVEHLATRVGAVEDMTATLAERVSSLKEDVRGQADRTQESLRLLAAHIGAQMGKTAKSTEALERAFERVRRAVEALESNVHRILTAIDQTPVAERSNARPGDEQTPETQMGSLLDRVWSEEG